MSSFEYTHFEPVDELNNQVIVIEANSLGEAYEKAMEAFNVNSLELLDIKVLEDNSRKLLGLRHRKVRIMVKRREETAMETAEGEQQVSTEIREQVRLLLSGLFERMCANVQMVIKQESPNQITVDITGEDAGMIIGRHGRTLSAIQYMVNIIVNRNRRGEPDRVKVILDSRGYRSRKERQLRELAIRAARRVKRTRKPVTLRPMLPSDRRVIHITLADDPDVITYSIGRNPLKRVVVAPAISETLEGPQILA